MVIIGTDLHQRRPPPLPSPPAFAGIPPPDARPGAYPRFDAETAAVALLGRRQRAGAGYQVRCPVHEDSTPSATIYPHDDGSIRAWCHAGCGAVTAAVYALLGVPTSALAYAAVSPAPPRPRVIKPAPARPYVQPDRPAPDAPLIDGTGWPALYDGATPYKNLRRALPTGWTGWVDYTLADGAPRRFLVHMRRRGRDRRWDGDIARSPTGLAPRVWRRPPDDAPPIYVLVEGEEKAAAALMALVAVDAPYGLISLPGTAYYERADYTGYAGALIVLMPDADDPRRYGRKHPRAGEVQGMPAGWDAVAKARRALDAAGATTAVVSPIAIRRAAARAGMPVVAADAADLPPADIVRLVDDALAPAPLDLPPAAPEMPERPPDMRCAQPSGLCITAPDVYGATRWMPLDCRRCPPCLEWRRYLAACRWDAGRPAGTIGAVAYITGLESPADARLVARAELRYGAPERWTAIDAAPEDGAGGYTLLIAYLDALDAGAADRMRRRFAEYRPGLHLDLRPARYITDDDIAAWTPDARRWYPTPDGGWAPFKPGGWTPEGAPAVTSTVFSRSWPARAFQPPAPDWSLGDGRLVHDADAPAPAAVSADAPDDRLADDRRRFPVLDDRRAWYAYHWRDGRPAPAPALWTAVADADTSGAARDAARAVQTATGMRCHRWTLIRAARGAPGHAYDVIREWGEGLAPLDDDITACAACRRQDAVPRRRFCIRCDPSALEMAPAPAGAGGTDIPFAPDGGDTGHPVQPNLGRMPILTQNPAHTAPVR